MDQKPDAGHDQDHHPGQRVEPERPRHLEGADAVDRLERDRWNPVRFGQAEDIGDMLAMLEAKQPPECADRQQQRAAHRRAGDGRRRRLAEVTHAHQAVDGGADAGQHGDEPDQVQKHD